MAKISANAHREVARWRNEDGAEYVLTIQPTQRGVEGRLLYKGGWPRATWSLFTRIAADRKAHCSQSAQTMLEYAERTFIEPRGAKRVK